MLSKGEIDSKKVRVEFSLEDMDMSEFQDGATYPQIKEYGFGAYRVKGFQPLYFSDKEKMRTGSRQELQSAEVRGF